MKRAIPPTGWWRRRSVYARPRAWPRSWGLRASLAAKYPRSPSCHAERGEASMLGRLPGLYHRVFASPPPIVMLNEVKPLYSAACTASNIDPSLRSGSLENGRMTASSWRSVRRGIRPTATLPCFIRRPYLPLPCKPTASPPLCRLKPPNTLSSPHRTERWSRWPSRFCCRSSPSR